MTDPTGATAALDEFEREVERFIAHELPPILRERPRNRGAFDRFREEPTGELAAALHEWRTKLRDRGWLTPAWPVEHGGAALSSAQQFVLSSQLLRHNAPRLFNIGISMIGPTLIFHGTEEQKRRLLPTILELDSDWCEFFSEPGAGSDLASLQTRAVRDGDWYVVNGQKIWTTRVAKSDWGLLLARTDPDAPKHRGISMFVVDTHSPGISVRPLVQMTGEAGDFNEVFFDDVRIPASDLIGEENRGWYYVMTTLDVKRSAVSQVAHIEQTLDVLLELARSPQFRPLSTAVRIDLVNRAIETEVLRGLSRSVAQMQFRGQVPNHESAVLKLYHTELAQRMASTGIKIVGTRGLLYRGEPAAPLEGMVAFDYVYSVARTIQVGTSEIQRNIIATRGLGLPRG